ncbi:MAG: ABC transporter ATP-binding protein [Acidimicrobiaceae bacterium]|nr:ABC transporter ATP-binding protein [Acidimicrobiaceae bacterium]
MSAAAPVEASGPGSTAAVAITGLRKRFGKFVAVDDLSLEVPAGAIYGLIGPNGAGKTTTFAVISSVLAPSSGSLSVLGHDPVASPQEVRRVLGYMPDSLGVYADLDVDEYLRFFAAAYKIPARSRPGLLDGLLELVALEGKRTARVDSLSRGMKQRLSLARALVHDPEVLILDEPASGLDPRARSELRALLVHLSEMGKTIVISSHILSEIEEVCSHIAIMQSGRIVAAGDTGEVSSLLTGGRRLRARFADGTVEEFTAESAPEQAALLRGLANDDARSLVEFSRVGGGLEEIFLSLTHGGDE